MTTLAEAREQMVETMITSGALRSPHWADAFRAVPREVFVSNFTVNDGTTHRDFRPEDDGYANVVYTDTSLITQRDGAGTATSSSSQPSLMAQMLEAFTADGPVLEIGTGTGYNTALLCHHYGEEAVVSVDVDPDLTASAREKLARAGYKPTIVPCDGRQGHPGGSPYGGILATCGVDRIPPAWLHQVRPGGVIVTNIGSGIVHLTVRPDLSAAGKFHADAASFMRARRVGDVTERAQTYTSHVVNSAPERCRTMAVETEGNDLADFLRKLTLSSALEVSLMQHDVLSMTLRLPDGTTVYGFVHPPSRSWARASTVGGSTVKAESGGPRDVWGERLDLVTQWHTAGCPSPDAYELTVAPGGEHCLSRGSARWELPVT